MSTPSGGPGSHERESPGDSGVPRMPLGMQMEQEWERRTGLNVDRCLREEPSSEGRPALKYCEIDGCIGEPLLDTPHCLAHLEEKKKVQILESYSRGHKVRARGVPFDEPLLERLLEALPRQSGYTRVFPAGADFAWARFRCNVSFNDCHFGALAYFGCATFAHGASFSGSSFESVSFHKAKAFRWFNCNRTRFERGASFGEARFAMPAAAEFRDAEFQEAAGFTQAVFAGGALFEGTSFEAGAVFRGVDFWEPVIFSDATVVGPLALDGARFRTGLSLDRSRFRRTPILGPFRCDDRLVINEVAFEEATQIRVKAAKGLIRRIAFPRVTLVLSAGSYALEDCAFSSSSLVARAVDVAEQPELVSLEGTDAESLTLSDLALRNCRFGGAHNLDALRVAPTCSFASPEGKLSTSRDAIADEHIWRRARREKGWPGGAPECAAWLQDETLPGRRESGDRVPADTNPTLSADEIASLYRSLRRARENEGDEPGSADFYYGEMEMRRRTAAPERFNGKLTWAGERLILTAYWALSGYGLRPWRAFAAWLALVVVGAYLFKCFGVDERSMGFPKPGDGTDSLLLSVGSSTAVGAPSEDGLSDTGRALRLLLRLLGPLLIGLGLLAVRGRVKR